MNPQMDPLSWWESTAGEAQHGASCIVSTLQPETKPKNFEQNTRGRSYMWDSLVQDEHIVIYLIGDKLK